MNPTPARIALILSTCILMAVSTGSGQSSGSSGGSFGVRGGVGTDVNLGLGFGAGVFYLWASGTTAFEFGADVYYSHTTESYTDQRGSVTVNGEDVTTLLVFGIRGNALFNFRPSRKSVYFIAGIGFVVASMQWEETETAPNWTAPYHDEAEGTSAGNIVNIGVGIPLTRQLDVRLEFPMLFFYGSYGKTATFVPTATLSLAYRFR
jgi:hypothetical protein